VLTKRLRVSTESDSATTDLSRGSVHVHVKLIAKIKLLMMKTRISTDKYFASTFPIYVLQVFFYNPMDP